MIFILITVSVLLQIRLDYDIINLKQTLHEENNSSKQLLKSFIRLILALKTKISIPANCFENKQKIVKLRYQGPSRKSRYSLAEPR